MENSVENVENHVRRLLKTWWNRGKDSVVNGGKAGYAPVNGRYRPQTGRFPTVYRGEPGEFDILCQEEKEKNFAAPR